MDQVFKSQAQHVCRGSILAMPSCLSPFASYSGFPLLSFDNVTTRTGLVDFVPNFATSCSFFPQLSNRLLDYPRHRDNDSLTAFTYNTSCMHCACGAKTRPHSFDKSHSYTHTHTPPPFARFSTSTFVQATKLLYYHFFSLLVLLHGCLLFALQSSRLHFLFYIF